MDMNDPAARTRLQREILELYRHYKINPLSAFVLPFLQLPIFVSFFFGCRDVSSLLLVCCWRLSVESMPHGICDARRRTDGTKLPGPCERRHRVVHQFGGRRPDLHLPRRHVAVFPGECAAFALLNEIRSPLTCCAWLFARFVACSS